MNKHTLIRTMVAAGFAAVGALPGCLVEGTPNAVREPPQLPPGAAAYMPAMPEAQPRRLTVLHTNDEHSHLFGFGPELDYPFLPDPAEDGSGIATTVAAVTKIATQADQQTVGGFVRRDYLINQLRTQSSDPVLTISAGDSTMGTLFHVAGTQAAPDWLAMALAGYDYTTLGNHEFDFGPDALALTIKAASNLSFGGMPKIISTNINFDDVTGPTGALLKSQFGDGGSGALVQPWDIKVMANGLRVGLLGALGYHAAFVGPNRLPITFSVPQDGAACADASSCIIDEPVMCASGLCQCTRGHCVDPLDATAHILAAAADLQPYVDALRNQFAVDVVVLISHMGTTEDVAVAQLTHGIDVIIGGHSHDTLPAYVVPGTSTILAQAGSYGRRLGELTIEVAPSGAVSIAAAELHDIDYTLDAEIAAGTSLPTVVSPALERAVTLTLGVFAPVIQGLNAQLVPVFNLLMPWQTWTSIYQPVATSTYDIVGGLQFQDTNLLHFVTDAELAIVSANTCPVATSRATIAVQANGVLRDDLQFSQTSGATSVADVFRVAPLGASPFEAAAVRAPGYPLMRFQLLALEILAGLEVGVTNGLVSDDFFLSYAGAKIEYDLSRPNFTVADPVNSGKITKITIGTDLTGYTWVIYDASRPFATRWQDAGGTPFDPTSNLITVVTNLYIGGFLDAFGLAPRDGTGTPIGLDDTILCWAGQAPDCGGTGANVIMPCKVASMGTVPWPVPEVKEWQVLLTYLSSPLALDGTVPPLLYAGAAPAAPRVIDVTP